MHIQGWPLGPHTEAQLVAVTSPDGLGKGKQWRTHAHFVDGQGGTFDLRLPWGLLPKLRPGSIFINGYLSGYGVTLEERLFEIGGCAPRLVSWAEATHSEQGWFRLPELQSEYCVEYHIGPDRVVMPCIQVLRALHVQARITAHAVLLPEALVELVDGELQEREAHLRLSKLVPQGVATKSFTKHLAHLLFEPNWSESFHDVFHKRLSTSLHLGLDKRGRIPLQCLPPVDTFQSWMVAGAELASGAFFAYDMVRTYSVANPPFDVIRIFHHKDTRKQRARLRVEGRETVVVDDDDGKRRRKSGPTDLRRPTLLRQRSIEHGEQYQVAVVDIFPPRTRLESPGNGTSVTNRQSGRAASSDNQPLNFDDERRSGDTRGTEFVSLPGRDTLPLHFSIFMKCIREAISTRAHWKVEFSIEDLSQFVSACEPADRLVMFARVITPRVVGYLVELEPLYGTTSYTLAVVRKGDSDKLTIRAVGDRLSQWLSMTGRSHVKKLLESDGEYRVKLATHQNVGHPDWANRILDKIDRKQRFPSWVRGIVDD